MLYSSYGRVYGLHTGNKWHLELSENKELPQSQRKFLFVYSS